MDENFGRRPEFARVFADLMEKYDLLWTATDVRCVNVSREDIEYFKARECWSLKFGVESGSQAILDSKEKHFTIDDVKKSLVACWDNGMFSPLALMVEIPDDDVDTIYETGNFIGELAYTVGLSPKDFSFALFYALPFPGTPLYNHCIEPRLIAQSFAGFPRKKKKSLAIGGCRPNSRSDRYCEISATKCPKRATSK